MVVACLTLFEVWGMTMPLQYKLQNGGRPRMQIYVVNVVYALQN